MSNTKRYVTWKKKSFAFSLVGLRGIDKQTGWTQYASHCLGVYTGCLKKYTA
jgi:hypothetical protein